MKKVLQLLGFLSLGMVSVAGLANAAEAPKIQHVSVQTDENQGLYGDSIYVLFNNPMYPLATGSENNLVAVLPNDTTTLVNPAKNYFIKVLPGPGSRTPVYQGTWADLGGRAVFVTEQAGYRLVRLYLPANIAQRNLFRPGDRVELTMPQTVTDVLGQLIMAPGNRFITKAS